MMIRSESPEDYDAIARVTIAAFENHPFSRHTEQFIVNALRKAGALTISLVAEREGVVVGHVGFSPVAISDGTPDWFGLGPVSVWPALQRQGIGKALINEALALLKGRGARGCALVGDPAYYARFGFRRIPGLIHEGVPEEVFLALPFSADVPQGRVDFHQGFWALS